jgi:threonine/homoserine/homoserine lactone efflux protein
MSIYETVGLAWVIFTSALATVGILYLAFLGLRVTLDKAQAEKDSDVPVEVKEMFKIAR